MAPCGTGSGYAGAWQAKAKHSGPEAEYIFSDGADSQVVLKDHQFPLQKDLTPGTASSQPAQEFLSSLRVQF